MLMVGSWLECLFKRHPLVVGEEAWMGLEAPAVPAEEAEQVEGAVLGRRIAFATGRWCARRALARLEIPSFILRNGADRAPRWPPGVVGSITHAGSVPGGFCGVVVGRSSHWMTLGLDAERGDALDPALWPLVLTPNESAWLGSQAPSARRTLASLVFSAKESFYKAQFPLTGRFLDFTDVEVSVDLQQLAFEARLSGKVSEGDAFLPVCRGHFLTSERFVLTGIAVPARSLSVASA
jgi:4'-phosphopantetheinyl transferase EntD